MKRTRLMVASGLVLLGSPVAAQEVSVPPVTVANPGGYANPLKLDTDRYDRQQRTKTQPRSAKSCSVDALPAAERRRMEAEYMRRLRSDGKARADAWVHEQGQVFRQKLIAQGVCPGASRDAPPPTRATAKSSGKVVRDRNGRPCNKTRMEMRPVAGLGGAPMTMGMVPVCAN